MVSAATAGPQPTKAASMKNVHIEGAPHELGYRQEICLRPRSTKHSRPLPVLEKQQKAELMPGIVAPGNCSAFVATGSYTKDGKPVIAHNNS